MFRLVQPERSEKAGREGLNTERKVLFCCLDAVFHTSRLYAKCCLTGGESNADRLQLCLKFGGQTGWKCLQKLLDVWHRLSYLWSDISYLSSHSKRWRVEIRQLYTCLSRWSCCVHVFCRLWALRWSSSPTFVGQIWGQLRENCLFSSRCLTGSPPSPTLSEFGEFFTQIRWTV